MAASIGFGSLFIALIVSLYGIGAAVTGTRTGREDWIESARQALLLVFPLLTISVFGLALLLVTDQYQVAYVAEVSSRQMPLYLKLTAIWGGQAGSLLFWSWLLAGFSAAVGLKKWDRDRDLLPWVIVVILVTLAFFIFLTAFFENPFDRFWRIGDRILTVVTPPQGSVPVFPANGQGLNPLLRHPGMIFHPPLLYLGFVSFVVPYAFAVAALITGRTDDRWISITRRWTLWAWLFLSLGLVLGARWAYDVLGWGGYWGWDPVEISALLPWLSGTAFLHAVMIQEKRAMFKQLNMVLIILTYDLVIFGTFLTRSGVLSSVHSFAQSAIGPLFFVFIAVTLSVSLGLLIHRWSDLKSKQVLTSLLTREGLILFSVLLFLGILVTSFWGVLFPLISEIVTGQKVTVGPPFYERATGPLFGGLLFLLALCPFSAWSYFSIRKMGRLLWKPFLISLIGLIGVLSLGIRRWPAVLGFWLIFFVIAVNGFDLYRRVIQGKNQPRPGAILKKIGRQRRTYGAMIIHIGVVLMALGVVGIEVYQSETQGTIPQDGQLSLAGYTMVYDRLDVFDTPDGRNIARAVVNLSRDGQDLGEIYPRRDYYYDSNQPMTIPGVRSTLRDDFYVVLVDWKEISQQGATFKVYHNPLVRWMWVGAWVFIVGVVFALWPDPGKAVQEAHKPTLIQVKK